MTHIAIYKTPECGRCPSVIERVEEIASEREDVELEIVDAEEDRLRALSDDVFSVPTVVIDGETKLTGVPTKEDIIAELRS
ncbi:thioredoxin family protein [Haloplanus halobius]|uniref:thioredoxin family protein n=1 Tax=Haloplanus halobius TaxID=2934938 RepID=UPI00200C394D|nr:thioredoxin family protein [Haloplanus sp. XH21]